MKAKCSMNDLISRSALLEELSKGTIITDDLYGMGIMAGNNHAMKKIEAAPAVDAVAVVLCKDCKRWLKDVPGCTDFVGRCEFANYMVGATGYCVYGERRADDADRTET